jgi:hypothetical protein
MAAGTNPASTRMTPPGILPTESTIPIARLDGYDETRGTILIDPSISTHRTNLTSLFLLNIWR